MSYILGSRYYVVYIYDFSCRLTVVFHIEKEESTSVDVARHPSRMYANERLDGNEIRSWYVYVQCILYILVSNARTRRSLIIINAISGYKDHLRDANMLAVCINH